MNNEPKFSKAFDKFACVGDSIHVGIDGIEYTARIEFDQDSNIDDTDCHNTDQSVTGCNDEQYADLLKCRKAWFENEWFYCGIVISATKNEIEISDHLASLWGIECNYPNSNNACLTEVANALLLEAIPESLRMIDQMVIALTA